LATSLGYSKKVRIIYTIYPIISVIMALAILSLVIYLIGVDPAKALYYLYFGMLGNYNYVSETLIRATPILLVSLGLAIAFSAKVWNIGAEGQLYMGGLIAAMVALNSSNLPSAIAIPLIWLAAGIAGALWAFIPAILKAKYEINEIFTTIMMNYIAIYFTSYMLHGPLRDPMSHFPETPTIPENTWLPRIIPGYRFHAGALFSLVVLVPLVYILLSRSTLGFKLRLIGSSRETARYCGIDVEKGIVYAMLLSGFFAGLAGANEVTGVVFKMRPEISPGYGFTGIAVALLGRLNAIGVALASIFMGGLINGSYTMHRMAKVPVGVAYFVQGLLIILVVVGEYILRRVMLERKVKVE